MVCDPDFLVQVFTVPVVFVEPPDLTSLDLLEPLRSSAVLEPPAFEPEVREDPDFTTVVLLFPPDVLVEAEPPDFDELDDRDKPLFKDPPTDPTRDTPPLTPDIMA